MWTGMWFGAVTSVRDRWLGWMGIALLGGLLLGGCSPASSSNPTPDGGTQSSTPDTSTDASSGPPCIGVQADAADPSWTPKASASCQGNPACVGAPMPDWKLVDFQPQSCGYGKSYGLRAFRGKVTVLVLLAAWCGFCQSQLEKLEQMRLELAAAGKDVHFLVVNSNDAVEQQKEFVKRSAIPLFQDTTDANVWGKQGGAKDDMYVYDSKGYLAAFFPFSGKVNINLSTDDGYNNLKQAILKAR